MVKILRSIVPIIGEPDIDESYIRQQDVVLLKTLLIDRTMTALNRGVPVNIKWAVDDYANEYPDKAGYGCEEQITLDAISSRGGRDLKVVSPRVKKRKEEQDRRTAQKAEVFTPSWICNEQNNLVDEAWFGRKDKLFNKPNPDYKTGFDFGADYPQLRWKATYGRHSIPFLHNKKGRTWKDYVKALRLEVSCGEAPYLTSRYDTTTGKWIEPRSRIGLLDRKLRIVTEQCKNKGPEEWLKWAEVALQGCYGFEWQGDNVLLARENMLYAVIEYYCDVFKGWKFPPAVARRFAEIISWNIWQMDGIKFVVPNTCRGKKVETPNLDGTVEVRVKPCEGCDKGDVKKHDGVRCRVMDWETGKPVLFMPPFEFKPIEDVSEISGGRNDIA